jgi:hypothetical protein
MSNHSSSTPLATPTANNQQTTPVSPRYISRGPIRPGTVLSTPRRDAFDRITIYLRRLAKENFFGNVAITLRDGEVQVVRTEQTLKLSEIPTTATPGDTATALGATTAVEGLR